MRWICLLVVAALGGWLACSEAGEPAPEALPAAGAGARPDVTELLRSARTAVHHPADGGGRAWLVREPPEPPHTVAGSRDRFRIVYEAGPLGVASGGAVYLLASPFWGWSAPQPDDPEAPGYTEVVASAPDLELRAALVDENLLAVEVTGRPLAAGERIELRYGAGSARARTDLYAEQRSPFWISVDGDGDGTRRVLRDSPTIDVLPGPARRLLVYLPTIARPGASARLVVAVVDAAHNAGVPAEGEIELVDPPPGLELPERVALGAADAGRVAIDVGVRAPGLYRIHARLGDLEAHSNPMRAVADAPLILWGDLHGHSNFSDGTGVPEDYFRYARDVSALDVVSLTDHDHWGVLPLAEHPDLWEEISAQTRRFHEPGRFVTLLGFEWTNWIHGHRHVLFFGDSGRVYDSVDEAFEHPTQLWEALERDGHQALTVAHHPGGGPVPIDWSTPPDPRFEPVVEIVSIHGSSEALGAPGALHAPAPGHFVRDALARGYRLGFVGSGDRHDGHPGAYERDPARGGLAAIVAPERTREAVLAALRARRVYATNGPRILLRTALGGHPMGADIALGEAATWSAGLYVQVVGDAPLRRVELVRSGELAGGIDLEGRLEAELHHEVEALGPGEYVYVRVLQEDGGMAWSSPFFVVP